MLTKKIQRNFSSLFRHFQVRKLILITKSLLYASSEGVQETEILDFRKFFRLKTRNVWRKVSNIKEQRLGSLCSLGEKFMVSIMVKREKNIYTTPGLSKWWNFLPEAGIKLKEMLSKFYFFCWISYSRCDHALCSISIHAPLANKCLENSVPIFFD